jgi:hypothetical protein
LGFAKQGDDERGVYGQGGRGGIPCVSCMTPRHF